jgi:hypothetical protein
VYQIESFLNQIDIKSKANRKLFATFESKIKSNQNQFNLTALVQSFHEGEG